MLPIVAAGVLPCGPRTWRTSVMYFRTSGDRCAWLTLAILLLFSCNHKSSEAAGDRKRDVIYRRKDGMAQTFDVFTPSRRNGAAIIWIMSGGYFSDPPGENGELLIKPLLDHGYTVFAVTHGAQPRYTIPDMVQDIQVAIRFIRAKARVYGLDPEKIGVYGASSGGHLALMLAAAGVPGDPQSKISKEREPLRMKAAAVIAAPSDYLNYGKPGVSGLGTGPLAPYYGAFAFEETAKNGGLTQITDETRRREIGRLFSPINHVSSASAPTIMFHGDKDLLVPLQQSQIFSERLTRAGVPCELVVKPGYGHDFRSMSDYLTDMEKSAQWFDKYIQKASRSK